MSNAQEGATRPDSENMCGRIHTLDGSAFSFSLFSLSCGFLSAPHAHGIPSFCVGLEGLIHLTSRSFNLAIQPETCWFLPADFVHQENSPGSGLCLLAIPKHVERMSLTERGPGPVKITSRHAGYKIQEELQFSDGLTPLILDSLFYEADQSVDEGDVRKARRYASLIADRLIEEYAQPPAVSELAREYGLSRQHMARVFSSRFGCTIPEYVRKVRVARAARSLMHSSLSLSEIAFQSGFADQSHLTRSFKKEMGITPLAYRRRHDPPHAEYLID